MRQTSLNDQTGYIWFNGEFILWQDAKVHVLTHSLHYASSVFEGERAYNGKIFELEAHTERLLASAATLRLDVAYSAEEINQATKKLLMLNNLQDGYVRPLIWRGSESQKIVLSSALSTNIMVACFAMSPKNSKSMNVELSSWIKPHPLSIPPQCKSSGAYQTMILALSDAIEKGYDDALLLDWRGYIAECSSSNIFFVKDGHLVTPTTEAVLSGITRKAVIDIAKEVGINTEERHITPEEIESFSECFVTGTAAGIKFVNSITTSSGKTLYKNADIIPKLTLLYEERVRR
ncbi:MAG: branched-chain amino acid transaminase [Pseudomonadota bacterium]